MTMVEIAVGHLTLDITTPTKRKFWEWPKEEGMGWADAGRQSGSRGRALGLASGRSLAGELLDAHQG